MKLLAFARLTVLAMSLPVPLFAQSEPPKLPDDIPASEPNGREDAVVDENAPFAIVEEMPIFRNDPDGPAKYLAAHVTYPEEAKDADAQGTVYASFVVKKDGSVANVKILRGVHPTLDAEVMRVLTAMPPDWKPGKQNGQNVNVEYKVPVKFTLAEPLIFPFSGKKKKNKKK